MHELSKQTFQNFINLFNKANDELNNLSYPKHDAKLQGMWKEFLLFEADIQNIKLTME